MKVLFVMQYPGYLRYYDSVVHGLAERGHEVEIVWELPRKQPEGRLALEGAGELVREGSKMPIRQDTWQPVARHVRRVTDFVRYLDPAFRDAAYLRDRNGASLPKGTRWLRRASTLPRPLARAALRTMLAAERAIPSARAFDRWLEKVAPDVIVLTPLLTDGSRLTDIHKAGRKLGIPVVMGVASWDHLTTKGMVRHEPDRVLLWNEIQREEAQHLHGIAPDRIEVTGAQPFDRWFQRTPSRDRRAFADRVGLRGSEPFVLFVGSTASISSPRDEVAFVRRWIAALRSSDDPLVAAAPVLVRPHPYNPGTWPRTDLSDLGDVAVWPRNGANIVDPDNRDDYFDSLSYASAVVGINTSAFIEASIVGRPTLTIRAPEFQSSQAGTLHFHYLRPENGGPVATAASMDEHLRQLSQLLADPEAARERMESFVATFVRPRGIDVPAAPIVIDAIEREGRRGRLPSRAPSAASKPGAAIVWAIGLALSSVDEKDRRRVAGLLKAASERQQDRALGASRRIAQLVGRRSS